MRCKLDGNEIKYSFSYLGNLPGGVFVFSLAQNAVHMAIMYSSVAGGLV